MSDKSLSSQPVTLQPAASPSLRAALGNAALRSGVGFDFLLAQARVESGLQVDAKNPSSSARGLFQFTEGTWLSTLQRHGSRFGMGELANLVETGPMGPRISDPARRAGVLALRNDPHIAALMAAGLAEDNRAALTGVLGREPDNGELYLAHFLGASGASRFLTEMARDSGRGAAQLFPRAARSNRAVFYTPGGRERSLGEIMDQFRTRIEAAGGIDARQPAIAGAVSSTQIPPQGQSQVSIRNAPRNSAPFASSIHGFARAAAHFAPPALPPPTLSPPAAPRPPMSELIRGSFSLDGASGQTDVSERGGEQVRRAYAKLKAFGL